MYQTGMKIRKVMEQAKICPSCGSLEVLPFESEEDYKENHSPLIVILSALVILILYLIFMVSSYMYFPVIMLLFVVVSAAIINRREKVDKPSSPATNDYICMSCNINFNIKELPALEDQ